MSDKRLDFDYRPITKLESYLVVVTFIFAFYGGISLFLDIINHFFI